MLKKVTYIYDYTAVFIVDAYDDGDALRQVAEVHHGMHDSEYYDEDEFDIVDDLENYDVVDIEGSDPLYEIKQIIDYAVENSADVTMMDNVIAIQAA